MSTFTNITDAYVVIVKDSEGLSNIVCLDRPWFQKGDKLYYNNTEIEIIDVLETSELNSKYVLNTYLMFKAGETFRLKPNKPDEPMYTEKQVINIIQFLAQDEDFDTYTSVSKETAKYYLERFKTIRST